MLCPLCKNEALERMDIGTISENKVLIRCQCCGFAWRETTNKVGDKDLVTIKIIRNGENL